MSDDYSVLESELTGCEREVNRLEAENRDLRGRLVGSQQAHQGLVRQLIQGPGFEQNVILMHTNAEFKNAVEQLAAMLPAMVYGLAAVAAEQAKKNEQMRRVAMQESRAAVFSLPYPDGILDPEEPR